MSILRHGLKKRIHVNKHVIARNRKHGTNDAVLTVQTSKGPVPSTKVIIKCECGREVAVMDQAAKPLSCGARVYIETTAEVEAL